MPKVPAPSPLPSSRRRNRAVYLIAAGVVTALGLASRRYAAVLPEVVGRYAGDTLWALMAFLVIGLCVPDWSTRRVAVAAIAVSYLVEASQLYHAAWIDAVRRTRLGALALGFGFLRSDLVCYAAGVAAGAFVEVATASRARSSPRAVR